MKTNKKFRGENWTKEEKDIFVTIMRQSAHIIDNKKTDTNTNKRKYSEWIAIRSKFTKLTGKRREIEQLKGFWKRLKLAAKKKSLLMKRELYKPIISNDVIIKINPKVFAVEENEINNDTIIQREENHAEEYKNVISDIYNEQDATVGSLKDDTEKFFNTEVAGLSENKDLDEELPVDKVQNLRLQEIVSRNEDGNETIDRANHRIPSLNCNEDLKRTFLEEEHEMKMKLYQQEFQYKKMRYKLELDMLIIEKQKKKVELRILKKSLNIQ